MKNLLAKSPTSGTVRRTIFPGRPESKTYWQNSLRWTVSGTAYFKYGKTSGTPVRSNMPIADIGTKHRGVSANNCAANPCRKKRESLPEQIWQAFAFIINR